MANWRGVHEYSADGQKLRTISKTPAVWPRLMPTGELLFLEPPPAEQEVESKRHLRKIDRRGKERILATLPIGHDPRTCNTIYRADRLNKHSVPLRLVANSSFWVGTNGRWACLWLEDHPENRRTIRTVVRIDLQSGQAISRIEESSNPRCVSRDAGTLCDPRLPDYLRHGAFQRQDPDDVGTLTSDGFRFNLNRDTGEILEVGSDGIARPRLRLGTPQPQENGADAQYRPLTISPSGRWIVLSGCRQWNCQLHYSVLLFDRKTGTVFPVRKGPWPPPLTASEVSDLLRCRHNTLELVAEAPIWWIGLGDRALIGTLVVNPGVGSWEIEGWVAP